jgi:hypothetical protein
MTARCIRYQSLRMLFDRPRMMYGMACRARIHIKAVLHSYRALVMATYFYHMLLRQCREVPTWFRTANGRARPVLAMSAQTTVNQNGQVLLLHNICSIQSTAVCFIGLVWDDAPLKFPVRFDLHPGNGRTPGEARGGYEGFSNCRRGPNKGQNWF